MIGPIFERFSRLADETSVIVFIFFYYLTEIVLKYLSNPVFFLQSLNFSVPRSGFSDSEFNVFMHIYIYISINLWRVTI